MKKSLRRVLSMALAMMLVIGAIVVVPTEAKAAEYTACLNFADNNWAFSNWNDAPKEGTTATVTADGTYSVTLDATKVGGDGTTACVGAQVFCVDIQGAQKALDAEGKTYEVTGLKVTADGKDVPVDLTKINTGDLEGNGNFRIEIYNAYGLTKEDSPIGDAAAFAFAQTLTVEFTIATIDKPAEEPGEEVSAEQDAYLMFMDGAYGPVQNWDAKLANTVVKGNGTYTVTLNTADLKAEDGSSLAGTAISGGAGVFCVDVVGLCASVKDPSAIKLDSIKVEADGVEVPVDITKLMVGDLEEKGNYRIEFFNMWGKLSDPTAAGFDVAGLSFKDTLSVTFTLSGIEYGAADQEEPESSIPFDPSAQYNAYLGLQTPNWTYRDAWNSANGIGSDYWGDFIFGNETNEKYGKVTDTVVAGNGTYSVSVVDFGTIIGDDFTTAGQDYFNLLYISTDIPKVKDIQVTDVKLVIDGKTVVTYENAFLDADEKDYVKILIQNEWNADLKGTLPYYNAPAKSIEMQFTISGFSYDKAAEEVPGDDTETPSTENAGNTDTTPGTTEPSGLDPVVVVIIVVVVVAIVAAVVVVMKKKGNK